MIENKLDGKSFDIVEDNISKIKELFPEIVNGDNEVDIEALVDIFRKNDETVVGDEEHYKFTWWGKKEAKRVAKETTTKTLRPYKNESKNWDTTKNIYIEGDNLDALKILLHSYRNRIKMIYIDPPFNTGKDFVYKDNRLETEKEHLKSTNQLSEDGFLFENAKTDGKYHSNWLNMIYPRLYVARKLLTEDGIIFISIDDNELSNIKKLCDEIFDENNFISQLAWFKGYGKNESNFFSNNMEYILVYGKNISKMKETKSNKFLTVKEGFNEVMGIIEKGKKRKFSKKDIENEIRLFYKKNPNLKGITAYNKLDDNLELYRLVSMEKPKDPCYFYDIIHPITKKPCKMPKKGWRMPENTYNSWLEQNLIFFGNDETTIPNRKYLLKDVKYETPKNFIPNFDQGGNEILNMFSGKHIFDYPKPTSLISYLMEISNISDCYILDFFSGSATTAHSLFKFNYENNLNCKFILVQIPEETDNKSEAFKAGYENICEIGKERIRIAGSRILEDTENKNLDVGFKVFKIDESNFIPWNPKFNSEDTKLNIKKAKQAILETANNLVDGRSELDLIYELLLKHRMDLNCSIEETDLKGKKVYIIDHGFALICLENELDVSIAEDLLELKEDLMVEYCQVILKDGALDDNSSININETLKANNVEFYTI